MWCIALQSKQTFQYSDKSMLVHVDRLFGIILSNNQVMKSGGEHQEKSSAQIFRADNKRQKKHNMAWNIVGDKLKKISWVKHVGDLNLQYTQH